MKGYSKRINGILWNNSKEKNFIREISMENIIRRSHSNGWIFIGVQLNKAICSSSETSVTEKDTFGICFYSLSPFPTSGLYYASLIEGETQNRPIKSNITVK